MKILMVSPYPPVRDGIAAYALQSVRKLRAEGHVVEVVSPQPSAAHLHLDLVGWRGPLALAKRVRRYDRVIVQFHPDVFYPVPSNERQRVIVTFGLILAFLLARRLEVRVHEVDYRLARRPGLSALLLRLLWKFPKTLTVHTEAERKALSDAFGRPQSKIEVSKHGADFFDRTEMDRAGARETLRIPPDAFVFLSIGFIQPHKGFDRAIRAFRGVGSADCRLYIVGSLRIDSPEYLQHLEELGDLAASTPGVTIHAAYVSDVEFDRWIVASDALVLPYRQIWSSGVMERAALFDRPVIATQVGGLPDQARPGTILVSDDEELAAEMRKLAAANARSRGSDPWPLPDDVDAEAVIAEIRSRAAAERVSSASATADVPRKKGAAPLRRMPALSLPPPHSRRPGAGLLKRIVRRLTAWEVDPIVAHVNEMRRTLIETAEKEEIGDARSKVRDEENSPPQ